MLSTARALRTASTASRRALATSTKSAQLRAAADAVHHEEQPTVSHGELAWAEVYGVDYEKMLQEAQDEAPIALHTATPSTAPVNAAAQQDIWSVVFGTTK